MASAIESSVGSGANSPVGGVVDDGLALDLRGVSKMYRGKVAALRGIDLAVRRGAVFGLLGPNGAGKSTLVKILLTVIRPTRAQGQLLGHRIGDRGALRRVGYLPEHHRFPEYLTARQVVDHAACMTGVEPRERRRRAPALLDLVGLGGWQDKRVGTFSKGMRQRLGIAQSLVNEPDLVILDEPTDGVDPVGRRDIRDIIHRLRERGTTVFLNSHLLSELEMVCDRVAILVQGVVKSQGTIDELTADKREYRIEVVPPGGGDGAVGLAERMRRALPWLVGGGVGAEGVGGGSAGVEAQPLAGGAGWAGAVPGMMGRGVAARVEGAVLTVKSEDPEVIQPLLDSIRASGLSIRAVRPIRPSLEDLFMEAVTDPATGEALQPGARSEKR